ncbi:hypothetical protein GGQ04_003384, partial [Salinibacter ruber]|nr:hypothetical protein [Salinibacter ruber]
MRSPKKNPSAARDRPEKMSDEPLGEEGLPPRVTVGNACIEKLTS